MPITFEIDRIRKTVFAQASGVLTKEDFFAYQNALQASTELLYFNECIDLSAVEDVIDATDANMMGLARLSVQLDDPAQPTRLAIIAQSDLHYGLARMYEAYRSMQPKNSRQVSIFRNRDDALRWLTGSLDIV
jgi:hypothetical protein